MTLWAYGNVDVKGKPDGVLSFINRFMDRNGEKGNPDTKYFPWSFLTKPREELLVEIESKAKDFGGKFTEIAFPALFAWSAYVCTIEGYPQLFPDACATLSEACMEDHVNARIQTEELRRNIEEDIAANEDGVTICASNNELSTEFKRVCI